MSTTAVRRTAAVLLATLLAAVAYYTVVARSAAADVRPPVPNGLASKAGDEGKPHRPVIGSGVKLVRNADGSVTRTR